MRILLLTGTVLNKILQLITGVKEGRPVLPLFVAKYEINPAVEILAHLLALYTRQNRF
jgi:hypothetical protein